jgi:hypothetical protein
LNQEVSRSRIDVMADNVAEASTIRAAREDNVQMATFAGSRDVTIDTPIGTIAAVFDITEEDGAISGSGRTEAETVDFYDVVADGDQLTWLQDVRTPMKLTLKFVVTVDGDTMIGTSKAGIFPASKVQGSRTSAL